MKTIKKVLIANRGEIALRIQQTAKALGIQTVAIYAPQDGNSQHIYGADQAYLINLDGYKAYLAQDQIIQIAKKAGCDAIHPGYGFLSENADFVKKVTDAGLVWIGPDSQTIRLMGDKNQARQVAQTAGVPTVPGAQLENITQLDLKHALELANQVGFPLILKDPLGGGGKGSRKVHRESEFEAALKMSISESQKLTGTTSILLERYLENARHVEIQIAGDGQNFIHLFERDCSWQRRYQKIVEEAPCKFVSKQTLEKIYAAAINLAKAVNYKNVGTVEFMVTLNEITQTEEFFFLEMNTRIQVEHSVTEMTTGVDLVALQFEIARTNKLSLKQRGLTQRGHAIQCRIYAEDPENNFVPCTGKINYLEIPQMPFIRVDHALAPDTQVTPFFDPMQAKITVYGAKREIATAYMRQALHNLKIQGVTTNIEFLKKLLLTTEFTQGHFHTQTLSKDFIEKFYQSMHTENIHKQKELDITPEEIGAIAALLLQIIKTPHQTYTPSRSVSNQSIASKNSGQKNIQDNMWRSQMWRAQRWQ